MRVHGASIGVFWSQLLGYVALSTVVEFVWYHRGRGRESEWRVQGRASGGKRRSHGSGDARERGDSYVWGFPAIDLATGRRVSGRHPLHPAFATANLLVSSLFAGATCEAFLRGASNLVAVPSDEIWSSGALAASALALFKAVAWQSVLEYAWHRLMHTRRWYRTLHKLHHHYKAPEVWDDLFIHPLEAFGYYCILYSPAFVGAGAVPVPAFLVYMALMGACGVLDHCGVDLKVPGGWYNTRFHDAHHELTNVNYAFPFDVMDRICGTYRE